MSDIIMAMAKAHICEGFGKEKQMSKSIPAETSSPQLTTPPNSGAVTLLRIDASVRSERSLSRRLADAFMVEWMRRRPADRVIGRDVGRNPPPFIDEAWIAAAFTDPDARTAAQRAALAVSDELIAELEAADILVVATPMYNYGLPAALKAWVDQVVRIGRSFSFDLARGDYPIEPTLSGKTMVLLTASGEFGFTGGGPRAGMNHLDPHLRTLAPYLGGDAIHHVAIEYQEFGDERHAASVARAHAAVPELVDRIVQRVTGAGPMAHRTGTLHIAAG